ncbi:hypothetical protein LINPERHAP1_LOCUS94, partial [Linum perenne]
SIIINPQSNSTYQLIISKNSTKPKQEKEDLVTHEINQKEHCKPPIHQGWP